LHGSNSTPRFLIERGLLSARKAAEGRGGTWAIDQDEIDRFNNTYCTVVQLPFAMCTSTRGLSDRLIAHGVLPVTGPKVDGGSIYFFNRADLIDLDFSKILAQTEKSSSQIMNEKGFVNTQQLADISGYTVRDINQLVRNKRIVPLVTHIVKKGRGKSMFFSEEQINKAKKIRKADPGDLWPPHRSNFFMRSAA